MNKRYIDFVPVKKQSTPDGATHAVQQKPQPTPIAQVTAVRHTEVSSEAADVISSITEVDEFTVEELFKEKSLRAGVSTPSKTTAKLGVIEDLNPRFVKTEVPKRALGGKSTPKPTPASTPVTQPSTSVAPAHATATSAKSKVVSQSISMKKPSKTPVAPPRSADTAKEGEDSQKDAHVLKVPKFVNTDKLAKRPLSKNVYSKKVVAPKEEPKGPVTIIAKPDKDSRMGLIIAVIITIILGAAAGTVAFLLLPK